MIGSKSLAIDQSRSLEVVQQPLLFKAEKSLEGIERAYPVGHQRIIISKTGVLKVVLHCSTSPRQLT